MPLIKAVKKKELLYDFVLDKIMMDGPILEFGVYKAASINYFAERLINRKIYGFDSFVGLPECWRAGFDKGSFTLDGQLPIVRNNVTFIKGLFEQTLDDFFLSHYIDKIDLIHIDCDLYSSTKTVLNHVRDKVVSGTIVVFDEYFNYPGWQMHEFKAFQEFVTENNLSYKYLVYNENHEQVAIQFC